MVRKIIGVVFLVPGVIMALVGLTEKNNAEILAGIIFALPGLFLLLKKAKTREEKEREEAIVYADHQVGLPLSEGAEVKIERDYNEDTLTITGGGNTFRLAFSKITDATIKTDVEIEKFYVSSVGGAIGGAALFGPLGAMIGGRVREKKSTTTMHYLIITYLKDGEVSYVGFDVSGNVTSAWNLINAISPKLNITNGQTIDL
ncbi:hypothetical protein E4K67_12965 [Desulfosporosinus fructosivorans]|uniref:Uncharacterized protein n=1 Tax=Desulfosporosinus fructosivorans TaxID=2018669 RepID=A0A4Z0R4B2_9FIRM|nr:hypothetical protein [Desulfosporosinus fructosivorans]TGE37640.1 hypothetical protein E4K67_12965 [Desulfosporosinus fructosivorans]